jgi:hypothetical protein
VVFIWNGAAWCLCAFWRRFVLPIEASHRAPDRLFESIK